MCKPYDIRNWGSDKLTNIRLVQAFRSINNKNLSLRCIIQVNRNTYSTLDNNLKLQTVNIESKSSYKRMPSK